MELAIGRRVLRLLCCGLTALGTGTGLPASAASESVAETLRPGRPLQRDIASAEVHAYALALDSGEYLHVVVTQAGANIALTLSGPGLAEPLEVDLAEGLAGREPAALVAEAAGTYRLEVRLREGWTHTGRYVVEVDEPRPAASLDRERVTAERMLVEGWREHLKQTAESLPVAIAQLEEALSRWRKLDDPYWAAVAMGAAAAAYERVAPEKAIELHHEALSVWQRLGDRFQEATTLHRMAGTHYDRGVFAEALALTQRALALWRALGDRLGEADALEQIALIHEGLGETRKSIEHHEAALAMVRAQGYRAGEATVRANLGAAYLYAGELQKALDEFAAALAALRALGNRLGEAAVLNNSGFTYQTLGETRLALDRLEQALQVCREIGERRCEAATSHTVGLAHAELGDADEALAYYAQSRALYQALGNRQGEGRVLTAIASAHARKGERQRAIELHREALQALRETGDRRWEGLTLELLGVVQLESGDRPGARASFEQALALRRAVADRVGEASTLYRLARLERDAGALAEARSKVEAAIEIGESLRAGIASQAWRASYAGASSYVASLRDMQDLHVDVLMRLHEREPSAGFDALALHASERSRARSLLELLSEARAEIHEGLDPDLLERRRSLQERLHFALDRQARLLGGAHAPEQAAAVAREVQELTLAHDQVLAQMRAADPRFAMLTQPEPLTAAEIQRLVVDAGSLLLEYALGEERSFVWEVEADALRVHELPGRDAIEDAVRGAYALLSEPGSARSSGSAERQALAVLGRMLLAPVAGRLAGKRLLVVPDGALHFLPFSALPDPEGDGGPLIATHEVVTLPSASVVAVLRKQAVGRAKPTKTLAVLADPVFDADDQRVRLPRPGVAQAARSARADYGAQPLARATRDMGLACGPLPRLPFSRREAESILRLVTPAQRVGALDFDASHATAIRAEMGDFRLLHFATHGFLNAARPELSGLVFSLVDRGGRDVAGFLSAPEVFNLRLSADMVVLSGCRTALGRQIKGEGLVGLTRAFMYAGAPRVVASLWPVDDAATAELMARFYEGMLGPQRLRPAAALRAAQLALLRTRHWSPPFYWAAFQLQGEWN